MHIDTDKVTYTNMHTVIEIERYTHILKYKKNETHIPTNTLKDT